MLSRTEMKNCQLVKIPFYDISSSNFKLDGTILSDELLNRKVEKINKETSKQYYNQLSKFNNKIHRVGSCKIGTKACKVCSSWYLWQYIFKDYFEIEWSKYYHMREFFFNGKTPDIPLTTNNLIISNDDNTNKVYLPADLILYIYKIDLISFAKKLFNYILVFKFIHSKNRRTCWLDILSGIPDKQSPFNPYTCNFDISLVNNKLIVLNPTSSLDFNLNH